MRKLSFIPRGTESFESASRRRLITNLSADRLLLEDPQSFSGVGPIWTRTIVAYPQAGMTFGHTLEYSCKPARYVLDTSEYRGIRGAALLFEDFELRPEGGDMVFIPKGKPVLLEGFPRESGWHMMNDSGIPTAKGKGGMRFLCRMDAARVGAVVRDLGGDGKLKLDVYLHHRPTMKLGAITEEGERASNVRPLHVAGQK